MLKQKNQEKLQSNFSWFFITTILIIFISFCLLLSYLYIKKINLNNKNFSTSQIVVESNKKIEKISEDKESRVSLLFVGDIILSRGVEYLYPKYKNIGNYPFQNIATFTKSFDLTIGNLETPITSKGPYMTPYSLVFNSNPKYVQVLKNVGFDILNLANNHSLDKGEAGARETVKFLEEINIESIGSLENCHNGLVKNINGIKIGFLGYSYTGYNSGNNAPSDLVCNWRDEPKIKEDILKLKNKVDFLILFTHTGTEYKNTPDKEDEEKMKKLVDFGVDAIISSHPHVIQKVENYKNGIMAYSLGNFVFDDQENPATEEGLAIEINLFKTEKEKS